MNECGCTHTAEIAALRENVLTLLEDADRDRRSFALVIETLESKISQLRYQHNQQRSRYDLDQIAGFAS